MLLNNQKITEKIKMEIKICIETNDNENTGRWEGGSGWGTRVHPWWTHVDVWQNRYNTVK